MKKRTPWIGLVVVTLTLVTCFYYSRPPSAASPTGRENKISIGNRQTASVPQVRSAGSARATASERRPADDAGQMREALTREMVVSKLQAEFGDHIHHPRIQLQAIQSLVAYLKQRYPDDWQDYVLDYLTAIFPDNARDLYARFLRFQDYARWLSDDARTLLAMSAAERTRYLWAKRRQLFGADAAAIWAKELADLQVADVLTEIDALAKHSFEEKADYFNSRLDEIYADQDATCKQEHPQTVMDLFLSTGSVQDDLRRMTVDQRKERLNAFRRSVGLDEAAVQRWAGLDTARDSRWTRGLQYMQQRDAILAAHSDGQQQVLLDALRSSIFGSEADTIRDEEAAGYYRYQRKRIYGRN